MGKKLEITGIMVLVILAILIAVVGIIYVILARLKSNFIRNHRMQKVEYCASLADTNDDIKKARVVVPETNGIYQYSLSKALLNASLLTTQSNCYNIIPIQNPPDFVSQIRLTSDMSGSKVRRMYATIFADYDVDNKASVENGKVIISFTGTFFLDEWASDLDAKQVAASALNNYEEGIMVHNGFYTIYLSIRDQIMKFLSDNKDNIKYLYITGHSLGGALSTICAFDLAEYQPIHYSFAAPRSGNINYANKFDEIMPTSLRVHNTEDYIASLPPSIYIKGYLYQHTKNSVSFTVNLGSILSNHTTAYIDYLPVCVKNVAPCKTVSN